MTGESPNGPGTDGGDPDGGSAKALWAIYSELAKIRMLLQTQHPTAQPPDPEPTYECRHCNHATTSEAKAERHAVNDHGAPRDCWQETVNVTPHGDQ